MTAEAGGTSGNYALYDMRKACQWVKQNIAQFGGDPDRITVAGQSGGAAGAQAAKQASTIASDIMLMGSVKLGELCEKYGRNAYVWLMSKENETQRGRDAGCPHCAEMPYVFGRVDKGERNPFFDYHWVGADYDFMELIQGYWYDFCASGDPNGEGRPVWKKYAEKFDICELCNHTHMIPADQMDKYRYFYEKLTENNFIVSLFGLPRFTPKNG